MSENSTMLTDGQTTDTAAEQGSAGADTSAEQTSTTDTSQAAADAAAEGTTEQQGEGNKEEAAKEGAPESYEAFAMPEGVTLDEATNGKLVALAKELNLTQAQAQRIADLGAAQAEAFAKAQADQFKEANETWANETRNDKEIGGDKLQSTLSDAKKAMAAFGSPDLTDLLNGSGLGNHPEVVRLFAKIGRAIGEDGFVRGGNAGGAPARAADVLYGNMNKR